MLSSLKESMPWSYQLKNIDAHCNKPQNTKLVIWSLLHIYYTTAGVMSISRDVYFRMVSLDPLKFALACVTTGGPATHVTWGKDGIQSNPDRVGVMLQKVVNSEDATYINEILIFTYVIAGRYTFYSSNAVTNEVSSTLDVSGMQICRSVTWLYHGFL